MRWTDLAIGLSLHFRALFSGNRFRRQKRDFLQKRLGFENVSMGGLFTLWATSRDSVLGTTFLGARDCNCFCIRKKIKLNRPSY